MKKFNKRADLQADLMKLQSTHRQLMAGRVVPSVKALSVQKQIQIVQHQIRELDKEAAERLALSLLPIDEILEIIAMPLLADVMVNIVAGVNATLRKAGLQESVFGMYTSQIRKAALAIVDTLDHADESLPMLLNVDDTLIDAVEKKIMSFIKQRLNITA